MSLKFACALLVLACMYYACEARHISELSSERLNEFKTMRHEPSHFSSSASWSDHHYGQRMRMQKKHLHTGEETHDFKIENNSDEEVEPRKTSTRDPASGWRVLATSTRNPVGSDSNSDSASMEWYRKAGELYGDNIEKTNDIFKRKN